jgi:hypothetical protein
MEEAPEAHKEQEGSRGEGNEEGKRKKVQR